MSERGKQQVRPDREQRFQIESPYRMNIPMLLLTLVLICYGLIMLFSASMSAGYNTPDKNPLVYVLKQGQLTLLGIVVAAIIIFIPIQFYDRLIFVILIYMATLALVIYTKFSGVVLGGSRRWIYVAGVTFQTSEFAKIALVFFIAGYRSAVTRMRKAGRFRTGSLRRQAYMNAFVDIILPASMILAVMIVVLLQPHMSGFIIMSAVAAICFLVSGISIRSWIDGGLIMLVVVMIGANILMATTNDTQKDKFLGNFEHVATRLNIFATLNEEDAAAQDTKSEDENGEATDDEVYQSKQSKIAIGSGGASGVGFGSSRQKYKYLPEAHNDYVYAIACEELGFIGGVSIIILFWAFLCGGLAIAWRAQSDFARILAVGYTSLIVIQAFLNIGVAIGIVPPTGITLPFFSYGGTANLFFLTAVGLILAVSRTGVIRKKVTYID